MPETASLEQARQSETDRPLIELRDAGRTYSDGNVRALDSVSVQIFQGDFVAIVGPSGCGKSTLLNLLGGLDLPTDGNVLFRGKALSRDANLDRLRAQEIGFVFQSFYLLPNLTAEENVQIPMLEGSLSLSQRNHEAKRLLELVGLETRMNHRPEQLSIGQRQRVAIARALANQPSILLADEPTGSLDSRSGQEVMDLLGRLNRDQDMTLVIVTHDMSIASRANRTIPMLDGRIVDSVPATQA